MRPSELAAILVLCLSCEAADAGNRLTVNRFTVDSEPPGAEIHTITGPAGRTPAVLSERRIYPNDFPDERIDWYGVIELRRPGCRPWRRRVTAADVGRGIHARLDCDAHPAAHPSEAFKPRQGTAVQPPRKPADAARRLRQLQVLQELLDEGLLTREEEARIRRRILRSTPTD